MRRVLDCFYHLMITSTQTEVVKVFLSGDVMTGRGVDQILPDPCDPRIHEPMVKSANEYVRFHRFYRFSEGTKIQGGADVA
jgi:hypothetical protein